MTFCNTLFIMLSCWEIYLTRMLSCWVVSKVHSFKYHRLTMPLYFNFYLFQFLHFNMYFPTLSWTHSEIKYLSHSYSHFKIAGMLGWHLGYILHLYKHSVSFIYSNEWNIFPSVAKVSFLLELLHWFLSWVWIILKCDK